MRGRQRLLRGLVTRRVSLGARGCQRRLRLRGLVNRTLILGAWSCRRRHRLWGLVTRGMGVGTRSVGRGRAKDREREAEKGHGQLVVRTRDYLPFPFLFFSFLSCLAEHWFEGYCGIWRCFACWVLFFDRCFLFFTMVFSVFFFSISTLSFPFLHSALVLPLLRDNSGGVLYTHEREKR